MAASGFLHVEFGEHYFQDHCKVCKIPFVVDQVVLWEMGSGTLYHINCYHTGCELKEDMQ